MFSTLIVPLDGSALAERVLPYAIRLTQARQGRLILMRAALAARLSCAAPAADRVVLFGVSILSFGTLYLTGDPTMLMASESWNQQQIDTFRHQMSWTRC